MMKCDPERILQVINNLVSNAVKFVSDQNGRIKVSARSENGSVVFVVEDNGIGIPKEKQQNLFKKFYQVDASLRRSTGGTGLGLAICKGIVEAHNGKIWVDSDEGRGTKFYFSIPIGGMN
jgi:signal transduction histidine kinase